MSVAIFRNNIRVSRLGHCARQVGALALGMYEPTPIDPATPDNPRFTDGHWHEYDMKRRMVAAGVKFETGLGCEAVVELELYPGCFILGHMDATVIISAGLADKSRGFVQGDVPLPPPGRYANDEKSMSQGPFWKWIKHGCREAFPSYFDQFQGYLHGQITGVEDIKERADHTFIPALYETLREHQLPMYDTTMPERFWLTGKNKETGQIRTEVIEKDEAHMVALSRRWQEAEACVAEGKLPERHYENPDNYECRDCPIRVQCWAEADTEGTAPLENPFAKFLAGIAAQPEEVVEAAHMYAVGKKLAELADQMTEYALGYLEPEEAGKYSVGPVTVNRYATKRTKWDHKQLEAVLPQNLLDVVRTTESSMTTRITVGAVEQAEVLEVIKKLGEKMLPLLESGEAG